MGAVDHRGVKPEAFGKRPERGAFAHQFGLSKRIVEHDRQLVQIAVMFDEIVGHPQTQCLRCCLLTALTGDDDDRDIELVVPAQRFREIERIHAGQNIVEQQDIVRRRLCCRLQPRQHGVGTAHDVDSQMRSRLRQASQGEIDIEKMMLGVQHAHRPAATRSLGTGPLHGEGQRTGQLFEVVTIFDQVIVRTGLERSDRSAFVTRAGQHHAGERQSPLVYRPEQIQSAAIRQGKVGQHNIVGLSQIDGSQAISKRVGNINCQLGHAARQGALQQVDVNRVIFDVQGSDHVLGQSL